MKIYTAWYLFFALLLAINGCVHNPITGSRGFVIVPEDVMNDLGAQSYAEVKKEITPSQNARDKEIVNRVASRIAKASGKNYNWEVTLAQTQEANAFVLPGGKIMVNTGILDPAQNEAALAFILGHEVGHAVAKHGAQRISQQLLAAGALATLSEVTLANSPERDVILAGLGLGAEVGVMLPFSRKHESEADMMGLVYMARAGYDPREAPKFWVRMGQGSAKPPEFLSTHPSDARRSADLERQMAMAMSIYSNNPTKYGVGERLH